MYVYIHIHTYILYIAFIYFGELIAANLVLHPSLLSLQQDILDILISLRSGRLTATGSWSPSGLHGKWGNWSLISQFLCQNSWQVRYTTLAKNGLKLWRPEVQWSQRKYLLLFCTGCFFLHGPLHPAWSVDEQVHCPIWFGPQTMDAFLDHALEPQIPTWWTDGLKDEGQGGCFQIMPGQHHKLQLCPCAPSHAFFEGTVVYRIRL